MHFKCRKVTELLFLVSGQYCWVFYENVWLLHPIVFHEHKKKFWNQNSNYITDKKSIGDILKMADFIAVVKKPVNAAFCRTRMCMGVIRLGNYMCIILLVTLLMSLIWLWIKCYWFRSNLMKSPKVSQCLMGGFCFDKPAKNSSYRWQIPKTVKLRNIAQETVSISVGQMPWLWTRNVKNYFSAL